MRYAVRITEHGPRLSDAMDGCRSQHCCSGTECGMDINEALEEIAAWHDETAREIRRMDPDTAWLRLS